MVIPTPFGLALLRLLMVFSKPCFKFFLSFQPLSGWRYYDFVSPFTTTSFDRLVIPTPFGLALLRPQDKKCHCYEAVSHSNPFRVGAITTMQYAYSSSPQFGVIPTPFGLALLRRRIRNRLKVNGSDDGHSNPFRVRFVTFKVLQFVAISCRTFYIEVFVYV